MLWSDTTMAMIALLLAGVTAFLPVYAIFLSHTRPNKPHMRPNRSGGRISPPLWSRSTQLSSSRRDLPARRYQEKRTSRTGFR